MVIQIWAFLHGFLRIQFGYTACIAYVCVGVGVWHHEHLLYITYFSCRKCTAYTKRHGNDVAACFACSNGSQCPLGLLLDEVNLRMV